MKTLANKNILVTGGAGYMGSHLCSELVKLEANVTILDDFSSGTFDNIKHISDKIHIIKGDYADERVLNIVLKNKNILCHFADINFSDETPEEDMQLSTSINAIGTQLLCHLARKNEIEKIIFSSHCNIYGNVIGAEEWMPPVPESNYQYIKSKILSEYYALLHDSIIIRYGYVYGQNKQRDFIYNTIKNVLNIKSPEIPDTGDETHSYVYIDDAIDATIKLLAQPILKYGKIFNIGSHYYNYNDLFNLICKLAHIDIMPDFVSQETKIICNTMNDSRITKEINWHEQTTINDGLQQTIDFWRKKQCI